MKCQIKIQNGEIIFSSAMAQHFFFERNEGKYAFITIDDLPSSNLRRYFEGAIVPAVYYQHPRSGWADFGEAREALKLEFLPSFPVHALDGTRRALLAKSTANLTKAQFNQFIEEVAQWMTENGLVVPEPEEYKAWRDSAPAAGEIYPQLKRLKEMYDKTVQLYCTVDNCTSLKGDNHPAHKN